MTDPEAIMRLLDTLKRAKESAPDGPGLMPQPRVPTEPPPPHWQDTDDERKDDDR
jgi:hypothetical protein